MNILITGGTGFVGKKLTNLLNEHGHHVFVLTRSSGTHDNTEQITYINYEHKIETLPIMHAIVNLAGDSLFGYWTKKKKDTILSSRIRTTEKVINFMKQMKQKPDVFISGSAIGYYGTANDSIFTEKTTEHGNDFLANVVVEWEKTAKQAEELGVRTVYTRFGVILGKEGALPLMSLPVNLFAGGKIGNGEQWISWIHIDDVVHLIHFCLLNKVIKGPINVTSPHPQRNKDFTKTLAKNLKRPYWIPTPATMIRLTIGEMSSLITKGQYVLPQKAVDHNFQFLYPYLENALEEINLK